MKDKQARLDNECLRNEIRDLHSSIEEVWGMPRYCPVCARKTLVKDTLRYLRYNGSAVCDSNFYRYYCYICGSKWNESKSTKYEVQTTQEVE